MCVNPYYGFQLAQPNVSGSSNVLPIGTSPCEQLVYEDPTQGGQISGRSWIWDAILAADEKFRNFAGYWPVPTQACDEFHFQRPYTDGSIRLSTPRLVALGEFVYDEIEEIELDPAWFLDLNNDTVLDTVRFEIDKPSTVEDLEEIVAFAHSDYYDNISSWCRAQIRPIHVKDLGNDRLRIDIPVWNLVDPILYRGWLAGPVDPNNTANYMSKLTLYRKWIDPARAVTIMRRTDVECACSNTSEACYNCENVDACIVNARSGIIRLDMRQDDASSCFCRKCAHRICIKYVAGDCGFPQLIARLAAAELRGDICCGTSDEVRYWQNDYVGVDNRGRVTTSLLTSEQGNPFGTKRGQVEAYRFLRERRVFKAVRI